MINLKMAQVPIVTKSDENCRERLGLIKYSKLYCFQDSLCA